MLGSSHGATRPSGVPPSLPSSAMRRAWMSPITLPSASTTGRSRKNTSRARIREYRRDALRDLRGRKRCYGGAGAQRAQEQDRVLDRGPSGDRDRIVGLDAVALQRTSRPASPTRPRSCAHRASRRRHAIVLDQRRTARLLGCSAAWARRSGRVQNSCSSTSAAVMPWCSPPGNCAVTPARSIRAIWEVSPSRLAACRRLLKKRISCSFLAERAARPMSADDRDGVPQGQKLVPDRLKQLSLIASGEIGAADFVAVHEFGMWPLADIPRQRRRVRF